LVILVAGAMVVVIGFAALAVDIGFFTHAKREVQNDADAVALAAVRELPQNQTLAESIAIDWADNNNVMASERAASDWLTFGDRCSGAAVPANLSTTTVRLIRNQATFFASIFGISDGDLNVCATAAKGKAVGSPDLLPWGVLWDKWTGDPSPGPGGNPPPVCHFDDDPAENLANPKDPANRAAPLLDENPDFWYDPDAPSMAQCVIVIPSPSQTWTSGNSGPLRLDDNQAEPDNWRANCDTDGSNGGDAEYEENLYDGSECGYSLDDEIQTKPGNVPKTCEDLDAKFAGTESDTIEDAFTDTDGDGIYDVVDTANPHYGLVPVVYVQPGSSGSSTTVILRAFAPVFVHSCTKNGSDFVITLTPVKSVVYVAGIEFVEPSEEANFPADWPLHSIKLID
jgi:hypothetical protein